MFKTSTDRRWFIVAFATATIVAAMLQVPQLLHSLDARSRGVLVQLNADEDVYLARVEEVLSGRPEQAAEAIVGEPGLMGSQFALLETAYGTVFRPTGWRAATVLQVMDSVVGFCLFLLLILFLRGCGFSRWQSYAGALLFVVVQFSGISRPIHQSGNFSVVLFTLCCIQKGVRGRTVMLALGGALLGILVGVYVWAWTAAWLWWGLWTAWACVDWIRLRDTQGKKTFVRLLAVGAVGVAFALPFLWQLHLLSQHPLYPLAVYRSGMFPSRLPESWAYSILFAAMAGGALASIPRHGRAMRPYGLAVLTVVGGFILINQQAVHGTTFNFVSHYLYSLLTAAICSLLLGWSLRRPLLIAGAAAACVYIAAIAYDGRWVVSQFTPDESRFVEQHFSTLLPVLDALPRTRVLSDPASSAFVAGSTHHDVVYSIYLKNVLMTHEEIAERYCLTVAALPAAERHIPDQEHLVYPDSVSAFHNDPSVRDREVTMVEDACARIDADPASALKRYGIDYVLWDEKRRPTWNLDVLRVPLTETARGEGWSLWKIVK